jgi:hypothetical protein
MSDLEQLHIEEAAPTTAAEAEMRKQGKEPQPDPQLRIDTTDEYLSSKEKFE